MKKGLLYSCLIAGATIMGSCTKNFDEVNTDPNSTNADLFNPNYLMSQAQFQFSNTGYDQLLFQSMWIQGLASTYSYYGNGDKYVLSGSGIGYYGRTWSTSYGALTLVAEMKNLVSGNAAYTNLDNCGTILRVLFMQRITDLYGDAPFSQADQAKTNGITTPVFDKQQDIYTSMLTQLDAAVTALDASKAGPTSDLFYGGDVSKWKRLGYTLMLRLAMRLTKVDPATAKTYAEKAYAGGTMSSIADNAKVYADYANSNGNANAAALLVADDFREVRWDKTLIDHMQATSDPRISAIAEITAGNGKAANEDRSTPGINTASLQVGMPNGYDLNGGATDISKAPNYPGATPAAASGDAPAPLGKYSRPRLQVYDDRNSANILLTYGESELLLAEAATRGWNTGNAATHYANALTADMQTLAQINSTAVATVDAGSISTYVAAHPLVAATALEQINTEYWVETCTTFNFNESFANWRRSGYPVLTPVTYTNQYISGSIPRRMPYPVSLPQTNPANYQAAVASMGGDTFATRVWWDKQ